MLDLFADCAERAEALKRGGAEVVLVTGSEYTTFGLGYLPGDTYAAAPWETVDWTPFDLVGVDAYRAAYNADHFADEMRAHFAHGKPVAVTEFGTCAYRGS